MKGVWALDIYILGAIYIYYVHQIDHYFLLSLHTSYLDSTCDCMIDTRKKQLILHLLTVIGAYRTQPGDADIRDRVHPRLRVPYSHPRRFSSYEVAMLALVFDHLLSTGSSKPQEHLPMLIWRHSFDIQSYLYSALATNYCSDCRSSFF